MDVDGASVEIDLDILGQNEGNEVERATNYTSSKVWLSTAMQHTQFYYWRILTIITRLNFFLSSRFDFKKIVYQQHCQSISNKS